ncbi:MAG: hypothetical protein ACO2XQ_03155 [Flavobacteriales bacterium]
MNKWREEKAYIRAMIFRWGLVLCIWMGVGSQGWTQSGQYSENSEWYISWGYNRSAYAPSDVHVWGLNGSGEAFDVVLHDAEANDMPERFQAKVYFHPGLFTIPQFNARFGKQINSNWWFSAGWDHMKYKLKKQWVVADGFASSADFLDEPNGQKMNWQGDSLWWGPQFNLEHSDGLNFVRFSLENVHPLWTGHSGNMALSSFAAAGAGFVVCSTDFTWAGERQKNAQHISGLGVGAHLGLRAKVHRRFFIQTTGHAGAMTLPWIRIQGPTEAGAEQGIRYVEWSFAVGYILGNGMIRGGSN